MLQESCLLAFDNQKDIKVVDAAHSFADAKNGICDLWDPSQKIRKICMPKHFKTDQEVLRNGNLEILKILENQVVFIKMTEQTDLYIADVPLNAISARALNINYPGEGIAAILIEAINTNSHQDETISKGLCSFWGIDSHNREKPFIFLDLSTE